MLILMAFIANYSNWFFNATAVLRYNGISLLNMVSVYLVIYLVSDTLQRLILACLLGCIFICILFMYLPSDC